MQLDQFRVTVRQAIPSLNDAETAGTIQIPWGGEMATPAIEQFAAILLTQVRDAAIASCDALLEPRFTIPKAARWRQKIEDGSPRELAELMIPDCVDETLFYLLHAIDEGILKLRFETPEGKTVDLTEEGEGIGEMAGWFMGSEDGWREKFSKERWIDDHKDLKPPW
jgi:hypothetical protein